MTKLTNPSKRLKVKFLPEKGMENFRLKVFRTVAEHLSFRRAAEVLHLTQPAVTLQIKALEEELCVRVLDRSGNRVVLTQAGRLLQLRANEIAEISARAREELSLLTGEHAGELRAGASTSIAQYVLPKLLGSFKREHPKVQLQIVSGNTEEIVEHLISGQISIGLIEGPALRKDVRTEPFMEDELVLIFPAQHPWARKSHVTMDDLRCAPFLLRERGSGTRRVLESALEKAGLRKQDMNVVMELDSTEAIISSVESGLGIGFVTRAAIFPRLALQRIATASVKGLRVPRHFAFVYPSGPKPEGLAGIFRRFTLQCAHENAAKATSGR